MPDVSQRIIEQVEQAASANTPFAIVAGGTKRHLGRNPQLDEINIS